MVFGGRAVALFVVGFLAAVGLTVLSLGQSAVATIDGSPPGGTLPPDATPYFLPNIRVVDGASPTPPARTFGSVPVSGGSLGRPAEQSPDVNLALRGYTPVQAYLSLINYNGDTDANAPQIAGMFSPARLPGFNTAFQVYDWNWNCGQDGCRGDPITWPYNVTMLELATTPGEAISIPARTPQIYAGEYKAMVLYAESGRITFTYTREDTPAYGYVVHLEGVAVAPELVALYQELSTAGRHNLPALRNGEVLGTAGGTSIKVAIRDTGMFMDPRACKDWWTAYMSECKMQLRRPLYVRPWSRP
jgi:hypothetical protein